MDTQNTNRNIWSGMQGKGTFSSAQETWLSHSKSVKQQRNSRLRFVLAIFVLCAGVVLAFKSGTVLDNRMAKYNQSAVSTFEQPLARLRHVRKETENTLYERFSPRIWKVVERVSPQAMSLKKLQLREGLRPGDQLKLKWQSTHPEHFVEIRLHSEHKPASQYVLRQLADRTYWIYQRESDRLVLREFFNQGSKIHLSKDGHGALRIQGDRETSFSSEDFLSYDRLLLVTNVEPEQIEGVELSGNTQE